MCIIHLKSLHRIILSSSMPSQAYNEFLRDKVGDEVTKCALAETQACKQATILQFARSKDQYVLDRRKPLRTSNSLKHPFLGREVERQRPCRDLALNGRRIHQFSMARGRVRSTAQASFLESAGAVSHCHTPHPRKFPDF